MSDFVNKLHLGKIPDALTLLPDGCVDLTVTSPPYDDLRTYKGGYSFDFEATAKELYRVTKLGGVVVWVVGDATYKGSETLTSFKQAIYFKEACGFNVHDTMIYSKKNPTPHNHNRYEPQFEYMFVFSKGKPKTFNPLLEPVQTVMKPRKDFHHDRNYKRGNSVRGHKTHKRRFNIWSYMVGGLGKSASDPEAFGHPAIYPEALARDHILSWSNPGDLVLDPFVGSGTTCKEAALARRNYVGFDCCQEYLTIAQTRICRAVAVSVATTDPKKFSESPVDPPNQGIVLLSG